MIKTLLQIVIVGLLVILSSGDLMAQKSLEKLLKESKLDYTKSPDGSFKVWVSYQGETTEIIFTERNVGSDESNPKTRIAYLYCFVLPAPQDGELAPAMLKKMAELNDRLTIGRIGINEQSGATYYNSSFWLSSATGAIVVQESALAHFTKLDLKKVLEAF